MKFSLKGIFEFAKAQCSAFIGGITDFLVMIFFTEVVGFHYVTSIAVGGVIGAVVNFTINRYWAFDSTQASVREQLPKFSFVVVGSILLKQAGTFVLTEFLFLNYKIARLITDAFVSFGFNYLLQKYWVFRKVEME